MVPDFLCWNSDLKSESADYERGSAPKDVKGVSEWSEAHSRTTLKDKSFTRIDADRGQFSYITG